MSSVFSFGSGVLVAGQIGLDKRVLGGKGANLAEMARIGLPVPPGFTISAGECLAYLDHGRASLDRIRDEVSAALGLVERATGKTFGNPRDPLLVSVRSGARVSMPGMMDTILNLGINDATVTGLGQSSGDERFALDSYRRFIQMYSSVVLEIEHGVFEAALDRIKNASSGLFVLGAVPRKLDGLDLRSCGMVMEAKGEPISVGAGIACLGSPITASLWLARVMAKAGRPLLEGDVILSGALGPMAGVARGDVVEARINGLGTVRAAFAAD